MRTLLLCTALVTGLSGCARLADSRINPLNWFGNSTAAAAPVTADGDLRPLVPEGRQTVVVDARPLIQTVDTLSVDRAPSGAIVRATGTAPTQGYFNVELVPRGIENGTLTLEFRAQAPAGFDAQGSAQSRRITAAHVIDAGALATIRSVRVEAASNARVARR